MVLPYGRSEARVWAREAMQGVFNVIIASYTADLSDLNEAGIRHDVRMQLRHGFAGFLAVSETALSVDEYVRFVEIAADEAAGEQLIIHHASFNTLEENIEVANRAAAAGAGLALLSYPPNFYPTSEDDIFQYAKAFTEAVDMAVMLFPVPLWGFERVHPSSISIDNLERHVDELETIVAVKAEGGHPALGGFTEAWNRLHERVVVTMPLEYLAIPLATVLPVQCIATSNTEYFGDVIPRALAMCREGKNDEAMRLYWQVDPARKANGLVSAFGSFNSVHRLAWKYQAWLTGYNGGPVRMPVPRINQSQMNAFRQGLIDSGVPVTDAPDTEYWTGRNPT